MTDLDNYLAQHYLNEEQLAAASGVSIAEIDALIDAGRIPAPAYLVSADGQLHSHVFGAMPAPGARPGRYFHPAQLRWISVARAGGADLKSGFTDRFAGALASLNLTTWRMPDSFDEQGVPIAEGLRVRTENAWTYFLNGTFCLCVANPVSEAHIAYKEVLQEKLTQLSENGKKTRYPAQELPGMRALIADYAAAAMPFSPVEYALCSRKRLVQDLLEQLAAS
jgi:hypothetical protein